MLVNINVLEALGELKSSSIKTLFVFITALFLTGNASANFDFEYTFGGSERFDGNNFRIPTGSESWAGFAVNMDGISPFAFPNGGAITFTAALATAGAADLRFKFEKNGYPDTEPSFYTSWVTVDSVNERAYTVNIPPQSASNTYANFLLYLEHNKTFIISDVVVNQAVSDCQPTSSATEIFIEAECYASTIGIVELEDTSDSGGGENVGWIDQFDGMIYAFDVIKSCNYRLKYRDSIQSGSDARYNVYISCDLVDKF
jgi:hypothetical protein